MDILAAMSLMEESRNPKLSPQISREVRREVREAAEDSERPRTCFAELVKNLQELTLFFPLPSGSETTVLIPS